MSSDPIRGRTISFHFADGPMANKTFEHVFAADGTVKFRMEGAPPKNGSADAGEPIHYEVSEVSAEVWAVSYVSKGYTLTTILDLATKRLVAFSSNDKGVTQQHGSFATSVPTASAAAAASLR